MTKMHSGKDLEKFYFEYQTEWMPREMSIQAYCSQNNFIYKIPDKWIGDIYKKVVPVEITGVPAYDEQRSFISQPQTAKTSVISDYVIIKVKISPSSDMEVSKDKLDYGSLGSFIVSWMAYYAEHLRNK